MYIGKHIFELGIEGRLLKMILDGVEKLHKILITEFWGSQFLNQILGSETKILNVIENLTENPGFI